MKLLKSPGKKGKDVPMMPSYRLLVALMGLAALIASFASQSSMSSAFICMTYDVTDLPPHDVNGTVTSGVVEGIGPAISATHQYSNQTNHPWRFAWTYDQQAFALSAYFLAYYLVQFPSGIIPVWLGIRTTLVLFLVLNGAGHLLTVPAASLGLTWLYVNRFVCGLLTGPLFSTVQALMANWTPRQETSFLFSLADIGIELGNTFGFAASSLACASDFQGGWPIVFYIVGGWSILIGVASFILLSDRPASNRFIGSLEREYIIQHTGHQLLDAGKTKLPLLTILRSGPVWAIIAAQFATEWIFYVMVMQVPVFLKDILELPDTQVSLTSGLPYLSIVPLVYLTGLATDALINCDVISRTNIRKLNEGVCKVVSAVLLMTLGFLPPHNMASAFVVVVCMACSVGFCYVGYISNIPDISPAHTGVVTGISQAACMWTAFVIPLIYNAMIKSKSRSEWLNTFYLTGALQVAAFLLYCFLGSGDIQPWARSQTEAWYGPDPRAGGDDVIGASTGREKTEVKDLEDHNNTGKKLMPSNIVPVGLYSNEKAPLLTKADQ